MSCSVICARPVPSEPLGWAKYSLPFSGSGKVGVGRKLTRRNNLRVFRESLGGPKAHVRRWQVMTQVTMTFGAWNCIDLVM
jgi:hypothetical protein